MADGGEQIRVEPIRVRGIKARTGLDLATVVGLGGGLLLIAIAITLGGSPGAFIDIPAVLIVIGGTLAVTTVSFSLTEMARTIGVLGKTVRYQTRDPAEAAITLVQISEGLRKNHNGLLGLQGVIDGLGREPFLRKGLGMILDGTSPEEAELILRRDIQSTISRHHRAAGVLRRAAEVAPAMGLIGTLIGLVQMLSNLHDPSSIGPAMAVALLTTFYGAILANMVFSPLASKLERNTADEVLVYQLYVLGVVSIGRQDNPRRLEMLLNSTLPPSKRIAYFD
ncbi:motility protein A [Telmatospirillum sp. J64-1]|uniref:motility protein A n=1 Tax=Telmatospirillum sp. J64-1 TaxID=2502183 RepID=UPI00115F07B7|nr:MotA/TolQ/ExbB proton channel family protein [Telmatospirillum sp. J64-1]